MALIFKAHLAPGDRAGGERRCEGLVAGAGPAARLNESRGLFYLAALDHLLAGN
ncbi:MAG: hypothetical protein H6896_08095 [Rhodovulum sp.]|nr:hypothetical protein [Rhodovulum sp.]